MKCLLSPNRHAVRSSCLITYLLTVLVLPGMYAATGECAESESLVRAAGSFDFGINARYFAPVPDRCCVDSCSSSFGDTEHYCSNEPRSSTAGSTGADDRDRAGLKRDTWYFLGYQAATIGILYAMPESVSGWTDEQKEGYSLSTWWDNVTHPEIDSDDFYINYLLHPYWGAAYFVRARERGYGNKGSFWYSVLLSSAYEFGAEALFEEPSIQDIIVTPVLGSLLGGYFMHVRDGIRERDISRGYRSTRDKWSWVLTDPLGSLNRQFDKLFGWETRLQIRPYTRVRRLDPGPSLERAPWVEERIYGIEFHLKW